MNSSEKFGIWKLLSLIDKFEVYLCNSYLIKTVVMSKEIFNLIVGSPELEELFDDLDLEFVTAQN